MILKWVANKFESNSKVCHLLYKPLEPRHGGPWNKCLFFASFLKRQLDLLLLCLWFTLGCSMLARLFFLFTLSLLANHLGLFPLLLASNLGHFLLRLRFGGRCVLLVSGQL